MPFDYKKEYKDLYLPPKNPTLIQVPEIRYITVKGKGDPNDPEGEYQSALGLLYGVSYTIKMSPKGNHPLAGYFSYVVPPLEGLWQQSGADADGIDYGRKKDFVWTAMIRLPEFVTEADLDWAIREAAAKKPDDFSRVQLFSYEEGLCVQCMHTGSYDDEPATLCRMHAFIRENGYVSDLSQTRLHHEIYLSDPRRTAPEKLRTVIRHPVRQA